MVFKFEGKILSFEDYYTDHQQQQWEVYLEDKAVESVSLRTALIKLSTWYVFGYQNGWFLKIKLFHKEKVFNDCNHGFISHNYSKIKRH